jgi:hypothetical protein
MKPSPTTILTLAALACAAGALAGCKEESSKSTAASTTSTTAPPPASTPAAAASTPPPASSTPPAPTASTAPPTKLDVVDAKERALADKFATDFFARCKSGKFEELGSEVTPDLRRAFNPDVQGKLCMTWTFQVGELKSKEFAEAWKQADGKRLYRFRSVYSKLDAGKSEIRVTLDPSGKIESFGLEPTWADRPR